MRDYNGIRVEGETPGVIRTNPYERHESFDRAAKYFSSLCERLRYIGEARRDTFRFGIDFRGADWSDEDIQMMNGEPRFR